MPGYYTYLISSLPMLHFGIQSPFSFAGFLEICQGLIPESGIKILETASITGEYIYETTQSSLRKWFIFDTLLRNELVKIRAARKRMDSARYLRGEEYAPPAIARLAMNAQKNPSILAAERMLDQERWHFLDELAGGHYFDIDFLVVYALKLLILARWEIINTADKASILEETLVKS
ncbi:MAG: DUF2764 domain-containing protein [Candidatus Omnitrophica bacterium]|nr:DUF2764 domain-containing protein [Candidatus Omnitrophota bacterium]